MTATVIGWGIFAIGICSLLVTARLDRRLQQFREPNVPAASYLGKFGRWRRDFYTADGQPLVASTRGAFALFCSACLLGALILEFFR